MASLLLLLGKHDERMLTALVLRRTSAFDLLMRNVTHLGDAWVTISVAAVLALGVIPGARPLGITIAFTLVVSHLWVQILKRTIIRQRPRLPVGCDSLIAAPDRFSFPSGHAASSLSLILPLATALPPVLSLPLVALGALVGLSRCYLGVHYPGDVLVGWCLAAAAALLAAPVLSLH